LRVDLFIKNHLQYIIELKVEKMTDSEAQEVVKQVSDYGTLHPDAKPFLFVFVKKPFNGRIPDPYRNATWLEVCIFEYGDSFEALTVWTRPMQSA